MLKVKLLSVIAVAMFSQGALAIDNTSPTAVKKVFSQNPVAVNQDARLLRSKLTRLPQFSALFNQQVFDNKGKLIQQASGSMAVSQPNQFRWLTNEPDESVIVSDGVAVWVYNPFVEQVTVMDLDNTVKQSPLWLIANQTDTAWSQFKVKQSEQGKRFSIIPNDPNSLTRQIVLAFDGDSLVELTLEDSQGQSSVFALSEFNAAPNFAPKTFSFELPQDVDLDDQRRTQ